MNQEEIDRAALAVAQKALEGDIRPGDALDAYVYKHGIGRRDMDAIYDTITDRVKVVLDD